MRTTSTQIGTLPHTCTTCGSRLTGRWERLTPGLCKTLIKFYTAICRKQLNQVHLQNECDLTKSEYTNFQKLRYFGLVAKIADKPGYWLITRRGRDFLRESKEIPGKVLIFQNHIQERGSETVSIADVLRAENRYWLMRDDFLGDVTAAVEQLRMF